MNAINHATTAMIIKKHWPKTPMIPILITVQFVEVIWVILNFLGLENTSFNSPVSSIEDIHLAHMPYSHSIASNILIGIVGYFLISRTKKLKRFKVPLAIGLLSHILLDLATHAPDIEIIPFLGLGKIGTGIYTVHLTAFLTELGYSVFCWAMIKGSFRSLAYLLILNFLGISFYIPFIKGPEFLFSSNKYIFPAVIMFHILFGLFSIYFLQKHEDKITKERKSK